MRVRPTSIIPGDGSRGQELTRREGARRPYLGAKANRGGSLFILSAGCGNCMRGTVSDFVLGSYVLCSKPKTKSDSAQMGDGVRLCSWFLRAVFQTKNKVSDCPTRKSDSTQTKSDSAQMVSVRQAGMPEPRPIYQTLVDAG